MSEEQEPGRPIWHRDLGGKNWNAFTRSRFANTLALGVLVPLFGFGAISSALRGRWFDAVIAAAAAVALGIGWAFDRRRSGTGS